MKNTAATILMQETGIDVFEAFDEHFGQPLGMEDWRVSDGYYHYERDKSIYPAYPFRMSARDAARFGLLYARDGMWGDERILSEHWVRRSSALYSIDSDIMGYGFMWWVMREPRFERHGMFAALGVGNQMIAVLPKSDMVIVNRANTYQGQSTPTRDLLNLIEQVLDARTGETRGDPGLVALEVGSDPLINQVSEEHLAEFVGTWDYPAPPLGLEAYTTVEISAADNHLVGFSPVSGTFNLYLQPDGSFHEEDSHERYLVVRDQAGSFAGISDARTILVAAITAGGEGNHTQAANVLAMMENEEDVQVAVARSMLDLLAGDVGGAEQGIRGLAEMTNPAQVEAEVNGAGYVLIRADLPEQALTIFELNTRVFPEAGNTWDSLGEALWMVGRLDDAIRAYEKSLEINPNNANGRRMIARIRAEMP